jgi:urea transport system permease protein
MLRAYALPRIFLLGLLLCFSPLLQAEQESAVFTQASALFAEASFDKTREAVDLLAASGDTEAVPYLQALMDGKLYQHKAQGTLVIAAEGAFTDELRKIPTNNSLRKYLRSAIGQLSLSSPDAAVRLTSANGLLETITPDMAPQLRGLLDKETDPAVQEALSLGLAMADLNAAEQPVRLAAIASLAGNLNPGVRNRLTTMTTDSDAAVASAAQASLKAIEDRAQLYGYAETLFFGLSLGSVLVLAAIGLAITFGVMGVINMAHGELIMLGAYTTYIVQQLMPHAIDYSLFVAVPAAFIVSGLMGILIERTVIRHLYGRPLETLLATFGISLILQQLVRTVISPQNVPVSNPSWMSGSLEINSVLSLTYNRLYIVLFCLMVFALLYFVLRKTNLGLQVRAVSQNRAMARAMGVRSARVDALTFGLGSGIAGVAGVALSQLTNVGPNLGQSYIIDSFMVVVFGGVGNLWGTLVAGLSLGVVNKVLEPWAGAVLAKILVLVFIILFIQKRPRGLFPQKGRAAGD